VRQNLNIISTYSMSFAYTWNMCLCHTHGPRGNASHRLPTPRCAKIENASSAIFRATVQPRSLSVTPAATASVLEDGISTATRTHASTRFVTERRHPHMPHQKALQHAPRARWRPAGSARAAPAAPRGPTAGTPRRQCLETILAGDNRAIVLCRP
jgi:hypothetical protein